MCIVTYNIFLCCIVLNRVQIQKRLSWDGLAYLLNGISTSYELFNAEILISFDYEYKHSHFQHSIKINFLKSDIFCLSLIRIYLHPVIWYKVFLPNTNNLYRILVEEFLLIIFKQISSSHHHLVVPSARISLTLSRHLSLVRSPDGNRSI